MQKNVFENPFFFFDPEIYDQRRRRYALGIFFIFLVSLIWIGSSVLSQYIYTTQSFDSPFLVTYLGISLFTFLLPLKYASDKMGWTKDTTCLSHIANTTYDAFDEENISVVTQYQEMKEYKIRKQQQKMYRENCHPSREKRKKHKRKHKKQNDKVTIEDTLRYPPVMKHSSSTSNKLPQPDMQNGGSMNSSSSDEDEERNHYQQHNDQHNVVVVLSSSQQQEQLQLPQQNQQKQLGHDAIDNTDGVSLSGASSFSSAFDLNHPGKHWNHSKHIFVAIHIAPVLFIANWLFSASLQATSVVSATVLVSTSCLFVFVLAVLVKEESFHVLKLVGVLLGILGSALTARHDFHVQDDYQKYDEVSDERIACTTADCDYNMWGDTLAVLAAVAFASYAVQVRLLCPVDEEIYSMVLLLGYIGLFITVPLLPLAIILLVRADNLSLETLILILIRGLFDYCISEYLHFRSVILTNATIATVGLGLTIPMAFIADFAMGKENVASLSSLSGAIAVSAGFLLVNMFDDDGHGGHGSSSNHDNTTNVIDVHDNRASGSELLENGIPMTIVQHSPSCDRSKVVI